MKISEQELHDLLHGAVDGASLDPWHKQRILRAAKAQPHRERLHIRKSLVSLLATAVVACFCTAITVAAVPGVAQKLEMLSQRTVGFLRPVEQSVTASEITMEVVAAAGDGSTLVSYVSLQDESGENRLADGLENISCRVEGLSSSTFTYVDGIYEREDGSVVLRILSQYADTVPNGARVTLSLDGLLLGGRQQYGVATGFTLADVRKVVPDPALNQRGVVENYDLMPAGNGALLQKLESGSFATLKAGSESYSDERAPWLQVVNAGVVDQCLHVLVKTPPAEWYNTCRFRFVDETGLPVETDTAVLYLGRGDRTAGCDWLPDSAYREYVVELPAEEYDPAGLQIVCDLFTYRDVVEDNWSVSYPFTERQESITADCNISLNTWRVRQVQVTAVGVTVLGEGEMLENSLEADYAVYLAGGQQLRAFSSTIACVETGDDPGQPDGIRQKSLLDEPIDLSQVIRIEVNGVVVWQQGEVLQPAA